MGTLVTKESVLLMTDQPETVPPLVRALEARGYRVIVVLTFGDALAWLEVETSYCLIVQLSTFTATDIAILCAHRTWAKRGPLVVVTSVPAPASLRHAQEAKLIHAGPALFLVTFLAVPSPRHLFTTRELKVCVTPTQIVTLCGPSGRAQPELAQTLPLLPGLSAGGAGRFLCGLLGGVVRSYEAIVKAVEEWRLDATPREEREQWRKRDEKL